MKKYWLAFGLLGGVLLGSCAHQERNLASRDSEKIAITILHTNDVHGHAWPMKRRDGVVRGGFAAQAALIDRIREEVAKKKGITLVLSAGDVNTGTPESDLLFGEPDLRAMSMIGYDAMVLGNHEFDGGIDKLIRQKSWTKFPVVSANVSSPLIRSKKLADPFIILEKEGVKFGVMGLTTDQLKQITLRRVADALEVEDPISSSRIQIPIMKQAGAELIIALTHIGISGSGERTERIIQNDDVKLAKEVPELKIIVGGHSHTLLPKGMKVNDSLIVQSGEKGEYLGRVNLIWDKTNKAVVQSSAEVIPILPSDGEDEKLKNLLQEYESRVSKMLNEQVGTTQNELNGERESIRHEETNLGNYVCDVIRLMSKSDIAIFNGGGIRSGIPRGPIRLRDLYRVLPFRNTLTTATITGKQLKEALQTGLKHQGSSGSFLQVSGIQYTAKEGALQKVKVKGAYVSDSARYKIASNNYLFGGGDYLEVLTKTENITDTGVPIEDILAKYIRAHPTVYAKVDKRIRLRQKR